MRCVKTKLILLIIIIIVLDYCIHVIRYAINLVYSKGAKKNNKMQHVPLNTMEQKQKN